MLNVHFLKTPDGRTANAENCVQQNKTKGAGGSEASGGAGVRSNWGRKRIESWALVEMKRGTVKTQESCCQVTDAQKRRNPLSAVPPALQLKFQDLEITVTNWDRIR
jgi:hypothetical protein